MEWNGKVTALLTNTWTDRCLSLHSSELKHSCLAIKQSSRSHVRPHHDSVVFIIFYHFKETLRNVFVIFCCKKNTFYVQNFFYFLPHIIINNQSMDSCMYKNIIFIILVSGYWWWGKWCFKCESENRNRIIFYPRWSDGLGATQLMQAIWMSGLWWYVSLKL